MHRLILVVILGSVLDHEDRLVGSRSFRYWFIIAAMVLVSVYVS